MREPTGGLFPPGNPLDNGPFIEGGFAKQAVEIGDEGRPKT